MSKEHVPVSAVIPCYRCGGTIRRALDSVAAQTTPPREVILVDDCSANGTAEALGGIAAEYPGGWVRVLLLPINGGPGRARSAGWDAAAQPYVAFLDADDSWHPSKLEIQYGWMRANPGVVLTGHPSARAGEGASSAPPNREVRASRIGRRELLLSNCFSSRSIMFRRDLAIGFHPTKRYMEDHWWLLQIVFSGQQIVRLELPLAFTFKADYGASGLSARLWEMERNELDNYWGLRRAGRISLVTVSLLTVYSLIKYARRCILTALAR